MPEALRSPVRDPEREGLGEPLDEPQREADGEPEGLAEAVPPPPPPAPRLRVAPLDPVRDAVPQALKLRLRAPLPDAAAERLGSAPLPVPQADTVPLEEGQAVPVAQGVGLEVGSGLPLPLPLPLLLPVPPPVPLCEGVAVEEGHLEGERVVLVDAQPLGVADGELLAEAEAQGVPVALKCALPLTRGETEGEGLPSGEGVGERLPEGEPVREAQGEGLPVPLGLPDKDSVPLTVLQPLAQLLGRTLAELHPVRVPPPLPLPLREGLTVVDRDPLPQALGPRLEEPRAEAVVLLLGQCEALAVPVGERDGEGEPVSHPVAEKLAEEVAQRLGEAQALPVGELLLLPDGEPLPLAQGVALAPLPEAEGSGLLLLQGVDVALCVTEGEAEGEGVPHAEGRGLREVCGEALLEDEVRGELLKLTEGDVVPEQEPEPVASDVGLCAELPLRVIVALLLRPPLGVKLRVAVAQGEARELAVLQALGLREREEEGDRVAPPACDAVGSELALAQPDTLLLRVALGEPLAE